MTPVQRQVRPVLPCCRRQHDIQLPAAHSPALLRPMTTYTERRLLVGDAAPRRTRHKPAIKAVPPSGLLGRLQSFLPSLEAANTELQQRLEVQPSAEVAMERGRCEWGGRRCGVG